VLTVVLAWLAVLAVCVAAVLFGQTARTPRPARRGRRKSVRARVGLFVSRSGPWLAVIGAAAAGALSGEWLRAAALAVCWIAATALAGVLLVPR
jgi:hypothetical protein